MLTELHRLQKKRNDGLLTENESDLLTLIEDLIAENLGVKP